MKDCIRREQTTIHYYFAEGAAYVFLNVHLSTLFTVDWEEILQILHVGEATIVLELSEREGLSGYSKVEVVRKMKELRAKGIENSSR
ncbi:hypothetical protein Q75_01480 [Bacillus coahuilensis p1.1.43]|uniref:Uncharacterized protein n=1 Tax=Bacillus coahuilensis p1.1.43 TaxID=1150625 RepID=A0A147KC35_9BACI|nr:hypothetical protein [Bacillus coahuilensis]KUP09135.1 hypothetical protein Q75_01480 [Bacillus coahuilensis p1.1.43]